MNSDVDRLVPRPDPSPSLPVLHAEGAILVDSALERGLDAKIPNCPGWTARALLAHIGLIHRLAGTVVRDRRREPPNREPLADPNPNDDTGLVERTREAHHAVVTALGDAPTGLDCWTIWPVESPRDFWLRRMVHETLIHRVDAQNAGRTKVIGGTCLEPVVAADGLDPAAADAEVRGRAGELLLLVWNRRAAEGLDVRGDRAVLDIWKRGARL